MSNGLGNQPQVGSMAASAATPRQNLRAEAGEAQIQSDRFASQVLRLEGMLAQMGLREASEQKVSGEQA